MGTTSTRSGASVRQASAATAASGLRQPTSRASSLRPPSTRPSAARHHHVPAHVARSGAVSPSESVSSLATTTTTTTATGIKRKDRDFEASASSADSVVGGAEATNINVVVRCRGRNEREVKENSAVMVNTDGVKGKVIDLFMGANALNNKSYNFDRVFSQAADQSMIFDDTVKPIVDEMLAGFNCTIFAYGQTGTGKTYTMSGDMTETLGMLSDEAGIIPRVLQSLFRKMELDDSENCIKVSFIELYNEELRDLLSVDDAVRLKIFDDASRRGHLSTMVHGMEEKHIKNSAEGIKVLQDGSLKRQVAATKCNDLSSRSHTVFTITAYVKKTNEHGVEDLVSAGKLNLVDLAGSENIQRSGAENKRAAEAGLINKSLLTLGRVINALVDKNPHIPYRESKLTRLLQDSLGGRTKTCIIATISPARANLEETISTLDYAFRAKNIKNKPQMNAMFNKKTLLKEFTAEIEKLKSELIATRLRNGVYLSNEAYEEMTAQNESRRIVTEEQSAKLETLESNLRNKVQELYSLTTTLMGLKKDHEGTRAQLDETKEVLDQTDIVLSATRKTLAEETELRKAHQETEGKLTEIGGQLINKLHKTVHDVSGLHAKNKRKSDLQSLNRAAWGTSQDQVADVTDMVERRIGEFQEEQGEHIASVQRRMEDFVQEELQKLTTTQIVLDEHVGVFGESKKQLLEQKQKSKEDMDEVLEEIKVIRDHVKEHVGHSLHSISQAAEKIAADVVHEMTGFHSQLHASYSTLGKDFKSMFEDLVKHLTTQRTENANLRRQLEAAMATVNLQNSANSTRIQEIIEEERRQALEDRQKIMSQVSAIINQAGEAQESRVAEKMLLVQKGMDESNQAAQTVVSQHGAGMDAWDENEGVVLEKVKESRDQLKTKLKDDWNTANDKSTSIQNTAKSVHAETIRVVDEQVEDLDSQMEALDDFVTRAKSENASHSETHAQSVKAVSNTVEQSFASMSGHFKTTFARVKNLGEEMELDINDLQDSLEPLDTQLRQPLANLREAIASTALQEYQPTGSTPQKAQYSFPTTLPRTQRPSPLTTKAEEQNHTAAADAEPTESKDKDNTVVFPDVDLKSPPPPPAARRATASEALDGIANLREVNPNVTMNLTTGGIGGMMMGADHRASIASMPADATMPMSKRRHTRTSSSKGGLMRQVVGEGRENAMPEALAESLSRRKSPRLN